VTTLPFAARGLILSNPLLTEEQQRAVETVGRPIALMASAGSGKTTVLVERYLKCLALGAKPSQILTVTFTNEAANQLKERILGRLALEEDSEALIESTTQSARIGTLHGFCYQVLDQYGSVLGKPPVESVLTPLEFLSRFEQEYRSWLAHLSPSALRGLLGKFSGFELKRLVRELFQHHALFHRCLQHLPVNSEEYLLWGPIVEAVAPCLGELERGFHAKGLYSFDDLENLTREILERSPQIRARLRDQIRFLLVDEFQDTSQAQWDILSHLVGSEPQKLFLVGDPKQSIYRFRHADFRLFLSVGQTLSERSGEIQELTYNFRSSPNLIEAINQVSEKLFLGSEVPFSPMRAGNAEGDAPPQPALTVRRYGSAEKKEMPLKEIAEVSSQIERYVREGNLPGDLAILFRVSDRIPDYLSAFSAQGIPAQARKTTSLFHSYEVADLVSFVRAVHNPLHDFSIAAFLRSRYVQWSNEKLVQLFEGPGDHWFDKLVQAAPPELAWFVTLISDGETEVSPCLAALFRNSSHWPGGDDAFFTLLGALSRPGLTLSEAVADLDCWEDETIPVAVTSETQQDRVTLLTVHAAKGLEFSHVYLVDNLRQMPRRYPALRLEPGFAPGLRYRVEGEAVTSPTYDLLSERQTKEDLEESKRILYVALTRAKKTLTVFLPENPKMAPKGSWGAWWEEVI
jgi:ATP-dependent exoDNAse (exonuclease V) beta subunit